jgi:uncharacterized protein
MATRTPAEPAQIAVRGVGRVRRQPDVGDLTLVVEAIRPTATQARDLAATSATRVIAALRTAGLADEDLQTVGIDVQPSWEHDDRGRARRTGFTVTHRIAARVRDLDSLGRTLDAALDAGATRVDGVTLAIGDTSTAETDARRRAVADARTRAETIAQAAGTSLGRLLTLSEGVAVQSPGPLRAREMKLAAAADVATPVESGSLEVAVAVDATWELNEGSAPAPAAGRAESAGG